MIDPNRHHQLLIAGMINCCTASQMCISAQEILAACAFVTGMISAMQVPGHLTQAQIDEMVAANIKTGAVHGAQLLLLERTAGSA